jgi:hypothetical protein
MEMNEDTKVIIIESSVKSDTFLDYLESIIIETLSTNNIYFSSIEKDGFYVIVKLNEKKELVDAMDLLSKISGISTIFIAKSFSVDYEILSYNAVQIAKKLVLYKEKFSIIITNSNETIMKEDERFLYFKKDLEFFIISEISSSNTYNKYVKDESDADKILFILIGSDIAYISLSLLKGKDTMPFKFLKESIICPIYDDEHSFLSLISVLNNGFIPFPFIFYSNREQLIKILKLFEKVIKKYPIFNIDINLINLDSINLYNYRNYLKNQHEFPENKKLIIKLMEEQIIFILLLKLKTNIDFICLPLLSYLHPFWFIKKNIVKPFDFGKIALTPIIYNYEYKNTLKDYHSMRSVIKNNSFNSNGSFLDIKQDNFEDLFNKLINVNEISSKEIMKFNLDIRKDDVLDILDSI